MFLVILSLLVIYLILKNPFFEKSNICKKSEIENISKIILHKHINTLKIDETIKLLVNVQKFA